MPTTEIRLARLREASEIARLARELIERGLPRGWTETRVRGCLRDPAVNGIVAVEGGRLVGFALMHYREMDAHLLLLAVLPACRRLGVGRRLLTWLEESALVAGIGVVRLEVRASDATARAFYQALGYRAGQTVAGYYAGRENAVRMSRRLWSPVAEAAGQARAMLLNWRPAT